MKTKPKRILQTIAIAVTGLTLSTVVACSTPGETKTYEVEGYPNYSETQVGQRIYEVRFTDTEGIKWKCFAYVSGYAGGLDGCEKVG
jgi:hypothetical protein